MGAPALVALLAEQVFLRGRPVGAAVLHRPLGHRPALFYQDCLPLQGDVLLDEDTAVVGCAVDDVLRQIFREEAANLLLELQFFVAEIQIHALTCRIYCQGCMAQTMPRRSTS